MKPETSTEVRSAGILHLGPAVIMSELGAKVGSAGTLQMTSKVRSAGISTRDPP